MPTIFRPFSDTVILNKHPGISNTKMKRELWKYKSSSNLWEKQIQTSKWTCNKEENFQKAIIYLY